MFVFVQQASYHPEVSEEVKNRALMYGLECTAGYIELLEQVLLVGPGGGRLRPLGTTKASVNALVLVRAQVLQKPSVEQKQQLAACSKRVAGAVTELIQTAEAMKGEDASVLQTCKTHPCK